MLVVVNEFEAFKFSGMLFSLKSGSLSCFECFQFMQTKHRKGNENLDLISTLVSGKVALITMNRILAEATCSVPVDTNHILAFVRLLSLAIVYYRVRDFIGHAYSYEQHFSTIWTGFL